MSGHDSGPSWAPVTNEPTVSVDVKQHSTNWSRFLCQRGFSDNSHAVYIHLYIDLSLVSLLLIFSVCLSLSL